MRLIQVDLKPKIEKKNQKKNHQSKKIMKETKIMVSRNIQKLSNSLLTYLLKVDFTEAIRLQYFYNRYQVPLY